MVGTVLPLGGATVTISSTAVADAQIYTGISATYKGSVTPTPGGATYPVFDLSVPALSLTANNVRGDGTPVTATGGGQVSAAAATMTYTLLGAWTYVPASGGTSYLGQVVTGYNSPVSAVPSTGTGNYTGNGTSGGVVGAYFVPSGTGTVQSGTLAGNVAMSVNFSGNTASGTFSNMKATPAGSSTATAWNDVTLAGTLSRGTSSVSINGQTSTAGATGTAGLSSDATGFFHANIYGPNAEELGGVWTLAEPSSTNGKAAFGTFGAK